MAKKIIKNYITYTSTGIIVETIQLQIRRLLSTYHDVCTFGSYSYI